MAIAERTFSETGQTPSSFLGEWWKSPILWGTLAYILFYAAIPIFPFQQELLTRYCTSHPLEYVTMGLFFLGMTTLILRWVELRSENNAAKKMNSSLMEMTESSSQDSQNNLNRLKEFFESTSQSLRETIAGRRLREGIGYVSQRSSDEKLEDHLRYFSDVEHDLAQRKLGFVNTISWAVPILGFLGTVMGITLAIANVTPDQLDQSLSEVTSGLAVAFDTTALSLTLSLAIVFTTYLIRSKQDEILNRVDQQIDRRLCFLLQLSTEQNFLNQHSAVAQNLIEASEKIVTQANEIWRTRLDNLQQQMIDTIDFEQKHFTEKLHSSISTTLKTQQSHLSELRKEEQLLSFQLGEKMEQAIGTWSQTLEDVGAGIFDQTQELQKHTSVVLNLVDKQQQLAEVQQNLHTSLDASNITLTLDQTLNSLTAAIQLLNARVNHQGRAA